MTVTVDAPALVPPVPLRTAAELVALRFRARLEARLAWLADDDGTDRPEDEQAWHDRVEARRDATADQRLAGVEGRPWARLVELFTLSPAEAALLEAAVAVAVEPALGPLTARAQRAERTLLPTEPLVKRLNRLPSQPIWRSTSALAMWGLVRPVGTNGAAGEPPAFEADPCVVDWLHGNLSLDAGLALAVDRARPGTLTPEWPLEEVAERLANAIAAGSDVRLVVEARPGAGQCTFCAAVAAILGQRALVVDPVPLAGHWPDAFMRVQRLALYGELAVIWREGAPAWPGKIASASLQFVCVGEGAQAPPRDGATDLVVALPEPSPSSKAAIWAALVPELADGGERLGATPGVSLEDLEEAARIAPKDVDDAASHLRAKARSRMQGAGRVVDPQFGWDDLILAQETTDALRAFAFEARMRPKLLERGETARLFASAAGLSALFSGPPGVGKSMAAQVIARDLGVNLLVVDLAATTSKYIGETAKNLSAAFARARAAGAALIFEEADAFFARRTEVKDANDRYANADTNHLLQLLEGHDGVVILSTNRRSAVDPAFIRRLRHVVEFPKPGPVERLQLWLLMLAGLDVGIEVLAETVQQLAATCELSPAQIKGAALSARYLAAAAGRDVSPRDLEDGALRELIKEGRSVPAPPSTAAVRRKAAGRG